MFVNITRSCHFLGSRTHGHGDDECATQLRKQAEQSREASPVGREKSSSSLSLSASCPARPARPAQTGLIPVLFYLWRSVADVMVCEISCALPILEAELRKARGGGGPGVNLWREQKIIIDGRNCDSKKSIHNPHTEVTQTVQLRGRSRGSASAAKRRRGEAVSEEGREEVEEDNSAAVAPETSLARSSHILIPLFLSLPHHIVTFLARSARRRRRRRGRRSRSNCLGEVGNTETRLTD